MASFEHFLPILLKFEGGYVNNPADPGGETNKGITIAVFRQCSRSLLGVDPTSANLKALTDSQAAIIYKTLYWDKIQGDAFQVQELANMACDFYVNAGTKAIKLLQRVLKSLGANLEEDGILGPPTLQALGQFPADKVHDAYKQSRIAYYRALGKSYPQFVQGWLRRANSFADMSPTLKQDETKAASATANAPQTPTSALKATAAGSRS